MTWLHDLRSAIESNTCIDFTDPIPWGRGVALSLAPHPDDPDATAVTLKRLAESGWSIHWSILTSGWSGVMDDLVGTDYHAKALAREGEERDAAKLFGLRDDRLAFLEFRETEEGELAENEENRAKLFGHLDTLSPDLVLLPHGNDTNATHRLVYRWFAEWADGRDGFVVALGNEDPKTTDFHPHLQVVFSEETARWKASLLECHRSQSERNQASRGITFAERILSTNRLTDGRYAERFEAAIWHKR